MPTAISSPVHHIPPPPHKKHSSNNTSTPDKGSPLQPSRHNNPNVQIPMNDDVAEKAKRRKSAHFGDLGVESGKGGAGGGNGAGKRTVSALAVQQHQQQQQQRKAKRLSAVQPDLPVVSMEVMNNNFEEWMKLATDNKITANNTWNFALIDYFADLTLLRNGPDDQSINFQKASCTLDGCIKIWTSRVDSVATETGKLLSGLAGGGGAENAENEDGDGDDEEGGEPKATRKTARSEATLAKSFTQLQVKKFDLEFTVDPLFKKTCADFDEGGAMGLLMNHLSVDGKGRVVFDAGDAGGDDEDEEEGETQEEEEMVDLDKLRDFVPSLDTVKELNISDTLSSFRFSSDPDAIPDFSTIFGLKDSFNDDEPRHAFDDDDDFGGDFPQPTGETHDFFGDEDYDAGPSGGGGFDDGASMIGDDLEAGEGYGGGGIGGSLAMVGPGEVLGPFDPRRQAGQGELVMAFGAGDGEEEGMFDYFDKGFGKAWAGADHWKLRKVSRKDVAAPAAGATKTARAAKAPFTIDFSSPSTSATSSKTLFAPASKSSIVLPSTRTATTSRSGKKAAAAKRKEEWLLPDDMHFSSRQLLRLFLKPRFSLRMRRNASATRMAENPNGEIDENFWAQAAADRADGEGGEDGMDIDSAPNPFESQFFHDDADDAFVDDVLDAGDGATVMGDPGEADDLWQGTQGQELRKSRPENVNFAKKAKRVDVKRLKDDIWSGLKVLVPPEPSKEPETSSDEETETPKTPEVAPVKTFDTVIQNLRSAYPQEKMSEISTSFCFICLLHLANEEGLKIETARFDGRDGEDVGCQGVYEGPIDEETESGQGKIGRMDVGEKGDRVVGELQALRVYKDLTAGRAA
ncbi:hypothetical protein CI109_106680 [Kwoniella shandongensis]|uniref:Condensin complex subunit 2 n=1 Tax=Kwoniella shandongensis TaxID=1734106 RepID=A0A5M6BQT2_9TREE|nr:uncharacterized protein CI109_006418 [Kwoniella shandongensis]KAA5525248.1 hypothetical protein CI109_006418 [Kwoniella shandongensis]